MADQLQQSRGWLVRPEIYAKAVQTLVPGKGFGVRGYDYSTLQFADETVVKPAEEELWELALQYQAEYDALEYQRLRAPEYPSAGELADAIYWQSQGDNSKMEAYLAAVEAVKIKYPKP